jgi:hypothetical protein
VFYFHHSLLLPRFSSTFHMAYFSMLFACNTTPQGPPSPPLTTTAHQPLETSESTVPTAGTATSTTTNSNLSVASDTLSTLLATLPPNVRRILSLSETISDDADALFRDLLSKINTDAATNAAALRYLYPSLPSTASALRHHILYLLGQIGSTADLELLAQVVLQPLPAVNVSQEDSEEQTLTPREQEALARRAAVGALARLTQRGIPEALLYLRKLLATADKEMAVAIGIALTAQDKFLAEDSEILRSRGFPFAFHKRSEPIVVQVDETSSKHPLVTPPAALEAGTGGAK